jgi:thioredoxin-dependent peroxiredoxin
MLNVGDKAPEFALPDDGGETIGLSQYKGHVVVLYFYPKDDTSGCTAQAKDFSCLVEDFAAAGAKIVGISPDSAASHAKFKSKYDLSVHLGADEDKAVANAYGVWAEKSMYGKKYMGVDRTTFLIDKSGTINQIWRKVKVPGHAEAVLEVVKGLPLVD